MLVADRAPQHTTPQAAPSVGRGSSVSADVADESYVVNPFRTGMRARPRNFSYKETDLSGTSLAATGGGGGGDGDGGGGGGGSGPASERGTPLEVARTASARDRGSERGGGGAAEEPKRKEPSSVPSGGGGVTAAGTTNRWSDAERLR